jgi:hypothetical protein
MSRGISPGKGYIYDPNIGLEAEVRRDRLWLPHLDHHHASESSSRLLATGNLTLVASEQRNDARAIYLGEQKSELMNSRKTEARSRNTGKSQADCKQT